jgi:hypothetical protein
MTSSQETRPARPVGREEFMRFHLWACGERRKGGDARARRARGKRPRRMRKDRGVAWDLVTTVGPGRVENDKCSYYVRRSLSWAMRGGMTRRDAMPIKMYFVALAFVVFAFDQTYANQGATMEGIGPVKIGMTVE